MKHLMKSLYADKGITYSARSMSIMIDRQYEFLIPFVKDNMSVGSTGMHVNAPEVTQVCGSLKIEFEFPGEVPDNKAVNGIGN